jgi:hypothetical protein
VLRRREGRPLRRRVRVAVAVAVALAAGACGADFRRIYFGENLGVVDPGRVLRSAQPGAGFRDLVRGRGLRSVLNLRGGSFADPWYTAEVVTARREGVEFYDLFLSATRRPTRNELLTLLDLFGRCRYPLLIHCKSGSDRTGLACALYRMAVLGEGPQRAREALTLEYGHVALFGTERLHEPLDEYATWLEARRLGHTPGRLREWVEREYRSRGSDDPFRPLRPGPRVLATDLSPRTGDGSPPW